VYLQIVALPEAAGDPIALRVIVRPLIVWLWIGGIIMALGTVLALVLLTLVLSRLAHQEPVATAMVPSLMVLIGLKARWAALVLIVFTACTIIFVHHFWDMQGDALIQNRADALKNLSIMGGLLLIVAVGAGPSAADDR